MSTLPERILASAPEEWLSAGHVLAVLFNCGLPGVGEAWTSGTEGGARRFVKTLRARRGYDLPRPLRTALLQRLSIGIGAMVEAADTADPSPGTDMLVIFRRWREELDTFKWHQSGTRPWDLGTRPGCAD